MTEFIADFHIHSKHSRATSGAMCIEELSKYAKLKGISLLGTGDFTHPLWLLELKKFLQPANNGLFSPACRQAGYEGINFILTAEVSNIFYVDGRAHQIHNMIFAPSLEAVDKINSKLEQFGNLMSDGRPMLHLEAKKLVKIVREADENCFVVPAHVWTPHFSVFGSNSGFDTIEECFGDQTKHIFALETGLSSDPAMNWRWSALDRFSLISNSDSHSLPKLGREANVFNCNIDYYQITDVLQKKDKKKFLYTIEFFPQEGKYHYDGHRKCNMRFSPAQTKDKKGICPACGKPVVVGVANRVDKLSDRPEGFLPPDAVPFKNLIPLQEIIAEARQKGVSTKGVEEEYKSMVQRFGSELDILLKLDEGKLRNDAAEKIAEGIIRVRKGQLSIEPGYDGEYGKIKIFEKGEARVEKQPDLF